MTKKAAEEWLRNKDNINQLDWDDEKPPFETPAIEDQARDFGLRNVPPLGFIDYTLLWASVVNDKRPTVGFPELTIANVTVDVAFGSKRRTPRRRHRLQNIVLPQGRGNDTFNTCAVDVVVMLVNGSCKRIANRAALSFVCRS